MVPQPVKAVVLLFPISEALENKRKEEDEKIKNAGQPHLDPTILWIKQTISNACGTIGLLHALANVSEHFLLGIDHIQSVPSPMPLSLLKVLLHSSSTSAKVCMWASAIFLPQLSIDRTPEARAKLLETTPLFANIHAQAASSGQTQVPTDLDTDLHFTCFVPAPVVRGPESPGGYRIVELDGRRAGPVDRGECKNSFLEEVAKVVKEIYLANTSSMQFSMVALCPSPE
ncbi:hypothetical protein H2248_010571 [Termitomyces sp. 'cryptogamus']|nr:hypothetical protein H2248_010571 [Termitomyces sp. 'cryptogamus']